MAEVAIKAASWLVGKALIPLSGDLLETWAASSELGTNIIAMKKELLYSQAMLSNAQGRDINNPALVVLLQKLSQLAYEAEDVLDELEYFRIQDELESTYEAADEADIGCARGLVLNARHTCKSVGKRLSSCSCAGTDAVAAVTAAQDPENTEDGRTAFCGGWPCGWQRARDITPPSHTPEADKEVGECFRSLTSHARHTVHAVGKHLLCFSSSPVHDHAPPRNGTAETPKLKLDRVDVSRRMKHLIKQLQPIGAQVNTILSQELLSSNRSTVGAMPIRRAETTSAIIEKQVFGRDEIRDQIRNELTSDKYRGASVSVLPIVGPGGVGKTTLTQYVYNDKKVQEYFQIKIWVCVSLDFNVRRLTQEILKCIPRAKGEESNNISQQENLDQLQKCIEKRLESKKFLLVLDDIWELSEDEWKKLIAPFKIGPQKGNMIIVTTRFMSSAKMIQTTNLIELGGLEASEFQRFFLTCVFGEEKWDQDLLNIGEQIIKKLKGSPLAAKTVGRLLRKNLSYGHWKRVLESKEWELQKDDHDIMPALKLSYDFLPFHLQKCFTFCALFPDDYEFCEEELVHLWIGLGIVHSNDQNKRMEDKGLDYLNDLVDCGFFKKEHTDCYVMHDLLHELALKISSHECLSVDCSSARFVEIPPSILHLSININRNIKYDEIFKKTKKKLKIENLRTLMLFGSYDANFADIFRDVFRETKRLRVLHLPKMSDPVESLLCNFSNLLHLRYLSIGSQFHNSTPLPKCVSRFYHLKVLDLHRWVNNHYSNLLPRGMSNLVNLRHFLADKELHSKIAEIGKLKFLQELRGFQIKKDTTGFEMWQLGELAELRSLSIYNLENVQGTAEANEAKLMYKSHLHELKLAWDSRRSNINPAMGAEVLESLRPHPNLRKLCIEGNGGATCPTWLGSNISVKTLESLDLHGVAWKKFPPFGQLLSLKELKLKGVSTVKEFGVKLFGSSANQGFQNLKKLEFVDMPELEKWVGGDTCHLFSQLEVLTISDCPKLMELPFSRCSYSSPQDENMIWFSKLQELQIDNCPQLSSLPPIPYTSTLCSVEIFGVRSGFYRLFYDSKEHLTIEGNNSLHSLDEKVLTFHNLTELQGLGISNCPPLALEHLQMLTSLKTLIIEDCSNVLGSRPVIPAVGEWSDVNCHLPIQQLWIENCGVSGKELTQLLSHLPALSELHIDDCLGITRLGMVEEEEEEQMETTSPCGLLTLFIRQVFNPWRNKQQQQQQQARQVEEGLSSMETTALLSNLTSLTHLEISNCENLRGEGMQLLLTHNLTKLEVSGCPNFFAGWESSMVATQEKEEEDLPNSSQLQELQTDDAAGFLVAPICNHFSSSLCTLVFLDEQVRCFTEEQEKALQLLTSLQDLQFLGCENLESLPEGLHSLPSLKRLEIRRCEGIRSLPEKGLPSSLQVLDVSIGCSEELKEQCKKLKGRIPKIILE